MGWCRLETFDVVEARRVQFGWSAFLWDALNRIYTHIDGYNYAGALKALNALCLFLPADVKKELSEEIEAVKLTVEIMHAADRAMVSREPATPLNCSLSVYRSTVVKNRLAERIVKDVTNKLVNVLDRKGYLEVKKNFQVDLETAKKILGEE